MFDLPELSNTSLKMYFMTLMDSVAEEEGGMIWENGTETCIISYETSRQSRFDSGYWMLGLVH